MNILLKLKDVTARLGARTRRCLPFRRAWFRKDLRHHTAGPKGSESGKARSIAEARLAGGVLNRRSGTRKIWTRRSQARAPSSNVDDPGQPRPRALEGGACWPG